MTSSICRTAFTLSLLLAAAPVLGHGGDDCDGWDRHGNGGQFCETRELTLDALPDRLVVDGDQNGGISVTAWDRDEVRVVARVNAWARSEAEARRIVDSITIDLGSTIRADGHGEDHWSVSYRIQAPRRTNLDLTAHNGGLSVRGIEGDLRLETHNGGLSLEDLAGDVEARTANGGVDVALTGAAWDGRRLDVETRNGGVDLSIPADYSAELEIGTVNGRLDIDFPVTVQGRVGRQLRTTLGSGGEPVRVVTTNGSVQVRRR